MVSYAVYAERRVSAFIQDRVGPNRVGPAGLLQPLADMFKLLLKEDFTPHATNTFYYWLAPCLAVMPAIITIAVVPFGSTLFGVPMVIADVTSGFFFVFAISSLGVYGIVIGGWASNSKYPSSAAFVPARKCFPTSFRSGWLSFRFSHCWKLAANSVVQYQVEHGWLLRLRWRLDESMEMAARDSNDHIVSRVHDRDFR
jgi:NADH-quinone oxidoreductase subunit H